MVKSPQIGEDVIIGGDAQPLLGCGYGSQCSHMFNVAVLRGDVSLYKWEQRNVQDGAVIHCTYLKSPYP